MKNDDVVTVQKKSNPPGFTIPKPPKEDKGMEKEMLKRVRDFADACHENSIEELKAAAEERPCLHDMETWGLTGGEWVEAVFTAIKEKDGSQD